MIEPQIRLTGCEVSNYYRARLPKLSERYANSILSCEIGGGTLEEWDSRRKKSGRGGEN
jgi:hypothetical protein